MTSPNLKNTHVTILHGDTELTVSFSDPAKEFVDDITGYRSKFEGTLEDAIDKHVPRLVRQLKIRVLRAPLTLILVIDNTTNLELVQLLYNHLPLKSVLLVALVFVTLPPSDDDYDNVPDEDPKRKAVADKELLTASSDWLFQSNHGLRDVVATFAPAVLWPSFFESPYIGTRAAQLVSMVPMLERRPNCAGKVEYVLTSSRFNELVVVVVEYDYIKLQSLPAVRDSLDVWSVFCVRRRCLFLANIDYFNLRTRLKAFVDSAPRSNQDPQHVVFYLAGHAKKNVLSGTSFVAVRNRQEENVDLVDVLDICLSAVAWFHSATFILDVCYAQDFAVDLATELEAKKLRANNIRVVGSAGRFDNAVDSADYLQEVVGGSWIGGQDRPFPVIMEDVARVSASWSRGRQRGFAWLWKGEVGSLTFSVLDESELVQGYIEGKRKDFVGRDWVTGEVQSWIDGSGIATRPETRLLLLTGSPGCGKTSWVAEFVGRGLARVWHLFQAGNWETLKPAKFVRAIVARLEVALGWDKIGAGLVLDRVGQGEDPFESLKEYLGKLPETGVKPILIVLDGLDEVLVQNRARGMDVLECVKLLLRLAPSWIKVVATTRRDGILMRQLDEFVDRDQLDLEDWVQENHEDVQTWLMKTMNVPEERAAEIADEADGNFTVARALLTFDDGGKNELFDWYSSQWRRLLGGGDALTSVSRMRVLDVLAVADIPLPRSLLLKACELSNKELEAVLLELGPILSPGSVRVDDDASEAVEFFHESVGDWLRDVGVTDGAETRKMGGEDGHKRLWLTLVSENNPALDLFWNTQAHLSAVLEGRRGRLADKVQAFLASRSEGGTSVPGADPLSLPGKPAEEYKMTHEFLESELRVSRTMTGAKMGFVPVLGIVSSSALGVVAISNLMEQVVMTEIAGAMPFTYVLGVMSGVACVVMKADAGFDDLRSVQRCCAALRYDWAGVKAVVGIGVAKSVSGFSKQVAEGSVVIPSGILDLSDSGLRIRAVPKVMSEGLTGRASGMRLAVKEGVVMSSTRALDEELDASFDLRRRSDIGDGVLGAVEGMGAGLLAGCGPVPAAVVEGVIGKSTDHLHASISVATHLETVLGASDWLKSMAAPLGAGLKVLEFFDFMQSKIQDFLGRKRLTTAVDEWRMYGKERVLIVKGDPGIGKTSWAANFVTRSSADVVAAKHFFIQTDSKTLVASAWLSSVVGQLINWACNAGFTPSEDCVEAVLARNIASVTDGWKKFLSAFKASVDYRGPPVLIVIDSLDEALDAGESEGTKIINAVASSTEDGGLPSWLKMVLLTRDDPSVLEKIQILSPEIMEIKSTDEENLGDLQGYVDAQMGAGASKKDVEMVLAASDGNFMYASQLMRHSHSSGRLTDIVENGKIPLGLEELYTTMLARLFPTKEDFLDVLPMLNVLAAAKAALPLDVFHAAMNMAGLENRLEGYMFGLGSVLEVSESTVRIYHRSFTDWLVKTGYRTGRYRVYVAEKEGHDLLASVCASLWETRIQRGYVDRFTCNHAVEGSGGSLGEVVTAIGGVDELAGEWYVCAMRAEKGALSGLHVRRNLMSMACRAGNAGVVRALVETYHSKALDVANGFMQTPMYMACSYGRLDVVKLLVKLGSKSLDKVNINHRTPLFAASIRGHVDVVRFLLDQDDSRGTLSTLDVNDRNPLWAASAYGYDKVVDLLLRAADDGGKTKCVNDVDFSGRSPLWIASERGHLEVIRRLLSHSATQASDKKGETPLFAASRSGREKVVELLLKQEVGDWKELIEEGDAMSRTPLWVACANGHLDLVELLIAQGADVDSADADGVTPLFAAAEQGHVKLVLALVDKFNSSVVNQPNKHGETPFQVACRMGRVNVVLELLERVKREDLSTVGKGLVIAAREGHLEVVEVLASQKEGVSGLQRQHALDTAREKKQSEVVAYLAGLQEESDEEPLTAEAPTVMGVDGSKRGLMEACATGDLQAVKRMVGEMNGAGKLEEVDAEDGHGRTAVWIASEKGHAGIVKFLLVDGGSQAAARAGGLHAVTPLWKAAEGGHLETVKVLMNYGGKATVDTPAVDSHQTPLYVACALGHGDVVEELMKEPGASKWVDEEDRDGWTPLYAASRNGHTEVVEALLTRHGSRAMEKTTKYGQTPLFVASESGHEDVVQVLLEHGHPRVLYVSNTFGETPMSIAERLGHVGVVGLLKSKSVTRTPRFSAVIPGASKSNSRARDVTRAQPPPRLDMTDQNT